MAKRPSQNAPKRRTSRASRTPAFERLRVVFTENQIQRCVRDLAKRINQDYRGKSVHVVGVLENCFMFMSDLLRELKVPVVCHFLKMETRDRVEGATPVRELMYTPKVDASGKDILLVDGVLQSGVTQDHLYRYFLGQKPASLRTATLVEKTDERRIELATDYVGFRVSGKFLVGYGLGHNGKYRNLPYIAALR